MLCVTGVYLRACLHCPFFGQKVSQTSLNSHYCHEAAATDHLPLKSDTAILSVGVRAICAVEHFPGIWITLLFGRATSVKSRFDQ